MNKHVKTLITLLLSVCMVICLALFASACGEDKDHFKVTVLMPDGKAADNLRIEFCSQDGKKLSCLYGTTDANGVSDFDISEFGDTTYYLLHIPELPDNCYFDANDDNNGGMYVYVKNGYSLTINLKEKPSAETVPIELANTSATQKVEPAIKLAGFYELVSVEPFTVSGEGYALTDGYYSVTMYLEPGDAFNIGTTGTTRTFTLAIIYSASTGANENQAFSTSTKSAFLLDLAANQTVHFVNPAIVNNHSGSALVIDGENYKTNLTSSVISLSEQFTVTTANDQAGTVIVKFTTPSSSTSVTVGESKDFEILLAKNENAMNWVDEEFRINFKTSQAGTYSVTITSDYESDLISILRIDVLKGDVPIQIVPESSDEAGKTYTATFELTANQLGAEVSVSIVLTNGTASDTSTKYVDYTAVSDDKVGYTALVTRS